MTIGGFAKQSFIDWEGMVASVIFTKGCNFRCGYCHNPSLVLPQLISQTPDIPVGEIFDYLEIRKSWIDGVVITGGEPTIHNDLPNFIQNIKALGYSVKLDTNGTNPSMLEQLLHNKLVDYVAMDIKTYPEKGLYSKITGISNPKIMENVLKSIQLLKNTNIEVEFRTTRIPEIHNDEIIAHTKFFLENCKRYTVNKYRDGETVESFTQNTHYEQL